jgi:hypothetical protein
LETREFAGCGDFIAGKNDRGPMPAKKKSSSSTKGKAKVKKVMHEYKEGQLKSGRSGKKVANRKQAVAIALSEARQSGAKIPPKKSAAKKKSAGKKTSSRKSK